MKLLQLPNIGNGGRLGNQLFTIASLIGIALRNGYTPRIPKGWQYRNRFNIPDEYFGDIEPATYSIKEFYYTYTNYPLHSDVVSITGYLQSPKYWHGYEDLIRQYLTPKGCKPGTIDGVAIHYRRTDYVGNANYYQLPMTYYLSTYYWNFPLIPIMAFSDDHAFIKLHHSGHCQHSEDPILELSNMAEYKAHITANSTFSWWGAYLSGGQVVRPEEWFAGPLKDSCSVVDLFPEEWDTGKEGVVDAPDCTFIVPFMIDSKDRSENLKLVSTYLSLYFDPYFIAGEINTNLTECDTHFDFDGKFHRTKALNLMTNAADTEFVINIDADVIIPPFQLLDMMQKLRNGADVVYPYDGTFALVDRKHFASVSANLDTLQPLVGEHWPGFGGAVSVGGCLGYNKQKFIDAGGENENFVSYSPEDAERFWRFNLLGLNVQRVPGALFHMEHFRGPDSTMRNPDSIASHQYWEKIKGFDKDQLIEHLGLNKQVRGYSGGWELKDAIKEHAFSLELAHSIGEVLKDSDVFDVLDIGAGPGFYSAFLNRRGFVVYATDISPQLSIDLFGVDKYDVTKGVYGYALFDAVLCLEVGEHIEQEFEQIVLDNICESATKKIILSWAIPGQGGFGHVNCQPNDYIIDEMAYRAWNYNAEQSEYLRARCSGCSWFENTIMVFDK